MKNNSKIAESGTSSLVSADAETKKPPILRVRRCHIWGVFDENDVQYSPDFSSSEEGKDWIREFKKGSIRKHDI